MRSRLVFLAAFLTVLVRPLMAADPAAPRPPAGTLLWQDMFNQAGGDDEAEAVAADEGVVAIVGETTTAAGHSQLLVRAYEDRSGALLWQDVDAGGVIDE